MTGEPPAWLRFRAEYLIALGFVFIGICLYPFYGSIGMAAIFAFGLDRPLELIRKICPFRGKILLLFSLLVFFILLVAPFSLLGVRLYQIAAGDSEQGIGGALSSRTLEQVRTAYSEAEEKIIDLGTRWKLFNDQDQVRVDIRDSIASVGKQALGAFSTALASLPEIVLNGIIFALFLFLFLSQGTRIGQSLVRLGVFSEFQRIKIVNVLKRSCFKALIMNAFVGGIQAAVITLGSRLFGFRESVVIFTTVFVFSFIPIIGASGIAFLLAAISFLSGNSTQGLAMVAVGIIGGTIDNIIRPFLISDHSTDVHPALSFAAIIGAIGLLGLKGLFLGPVILTATFSLLNERREYLPLEKRREAG